MKGTKKIRKIIVMCRLKTLEHQHAREYLSANTSRYMKPPTSKPQLQI